MSSTALSARSASSLCNRSYPSAESGKPSDPPCVRKTTRATALMASRRIATTRTGPRPERGRPGTGPPGGIDQPGLGGGSTTRGWTVSLRDATTSYASAVREMTTERRLTSFSHGAGCGCKLGPDDLRTVLGGVTLPRASADLLVAADTGDD